MGPILKIICKSGIGQETLSIRSWMICLMMSITIFSCKKEIKQELIFTESYMKMFPEDGNQYAQYIFPSSDDGCILIYTENDSLMIRKLDSKGNMQWIKTAPYLQFTGDIYARETDDHKIILSNSYKYGSFCKLDYDGNILAVYSYNLGSDYIQNSFPVETRDGHYLVTFTDGSSHGNPSNNSVAIMDHDGTLQGYGKFPDSNFTYNGNKSKILWICLTKCDTIGDFYFYGLAFENWRFNWSENKRLFLAHLNYNDTGKLFRKVVYLDPPYMDYENLGWWPLTTKDKSLVLAVSRKNHDLITEGNIVKVDTNFNVLWQRQLKIGAYGTFCTNAIECPDGSILITGSCKPGEKLVEQPFACKLDKNGNFLWAKTFANIYYGFFMYGQQLRSGNIQFFGNTLSMGKGATSNDLFVYKTDAYGNLK